MNKQDRDDVKLYIEVLGRYTGSKGSGGTTGGLLFTVNAKGTAEYIFIDDVRELAMTPNVVLQHYVERQRAIEEIKLKLEQEALQLTRGRSLGFGL